MNGNVTKLKTKIEVGSVVATAFKRKKATVVKMIDDKTMLVRWHETGEECEALRVAFVLA
jgi:hypothetical protein